MANCINVSSAEFIALQKESGVNPVILQAQISLWQKEVNSFNFPKTTLFLQKTNDTEGIIASEKTIRDLAANISNRIGIPYKIITDKSQEFKGKLEKGEAVVNLAYATLDTPIHEILGHPIIRAIKTKNNKKLDYRLASEVMFDEKAPAPYVVATEYWDDNGEVYGDYEFFETKEDGQKFIDKYNQEANNISELYQNLLKELETGKGKEVLDRIKRDYNLKNKPEIITLESITGIGVDYEVNGKSFGTKAEAIKEQEKVTTYYTLEEQQEEAIVELLGLMTAEKLDASKDGKLISLLKRLLKEIKVFMKELLSKREVDIDSLPDNMTIGDIADLLAYSNSKLILPGHEVEYTTPDNQKFKTYAEASKHISNLANNSEQTDKEYKKYVATYHNYFRDDDGGYDSIIRTLDFSSKEEAEKYFKARINVELISIEEMVAFFSEDFMKTNKEYEQAKEIIEEWKKVNDIQYNPEEIYSRGQEFVSVVGAYSSFDVNLMMQNLLQHIEDNEKAGGKFAISAFTKPIDKNIGHLEGGGGKIKFKIYPKSEDILWAANTDVYSGSVWDAGYQVNKDKKSELLGVSYSKYPSLRNIHSVQPNLADIVDNLAHHHNELGITLTGNNFRFEYDEDIPFQTKKIIDSINSILDQKYGKLVKPDIRKKEKPTWTAYDTNDRKVIKRFDTKEEAQKWVNENREDALNNEIALEAIKVTEIGLVPTKTKNNLKQHIGEIKNKNTVKPYDEKGSSYMFFEKYKKEDLTIGVNPNGRWEIQTKEQGTWGAKETNVFVYATKEEAENALENVYKEIEKDKLLAKKEYTSQAIINSKVAKLKEVAKKYPRSLIRSEVKKIKVATGATYHNLGFVEEDELPFQKIQKGFEREKTTNTQYQSNYSLFTGKSDSKTILTEILAKPQSETIRIAAQWLLDNNKLNNVSISTVNEMFKKEAVGSYSLNNNNISILKDFPYTEGYFQRVILHELIHSLTSQPIKIAIEYLRKGFIETKKGLYSPNENMFKFLEGTDKATRDYINTLMELRNSSYEFMVAKYGKYEVDSNMHNDPRFYGLTNITEFIAEVFSNDIFKNELERYHPNFFQKLINAIAKFFGINTPNGVAEQAIEAVMKYTKLKSKNDFGSGMQLAQDPKTGNAFYPKEKVVFNEEMDYIVEKEVAPNLTKEEQHSFASSMAVNVLNQFYSKAFDGIDVFDGKDSSIKQKVKEEILKTLEIGSFQEQALKEKFENEFDTLWEKTVQYVNREFRVDFTESEETEDDKLQKEWESEVYNDISGSQSASAGVKWFIMTTKKVDKEGKVIKNQLTGLDEFINMREVFPVMLERLTQTSSNNDLVNTLRKMSSINPSFNLMADKLSQNANLINMVKAEFNKVRGKSVIALYSEDNQGETSYKVYDEFNNSRPEKIIEEEWKQTISENIKEGRYTSLDFENSRLVAESKFINLNNKLVANPVPLSESNELTEKGKEAVEVLKAYSNLINENFLSDDTIKDIVITSRNFDDVNKTISIIKDILTHVKKNSNDIGGFLLRLTDKEKLFRDIKVEVMQTNVKNKPIYPYTLPSFITKLFKKYNNASQSKELTEEITKELKTFSEEPARQFDNLLWNDKFFTGFVNYKVVDGIKVFESVNWEFLSQITVVDIGGAKNDTTKEGQQYKDMSESDFMLDSLTGYLGTKTDRNFKHEFVYLPIQTPSDKSNSKKVRTPRIPLAKHTTKVTGEYLNEFVLNQDKPFNAPTKSKLFMALKRTALQEIQRIRQANALLFNQDDLILGKFTLKADIKALHEQIDTLEVAEYNVQVKKLIGSLIQYYHYRELVYTATGKIDLDATLLKKGRPTGNVFQFSNMVIDNSTNKFETNEFYADRTKGNPTNFITLSDVKGFTENGAVNYNIENARIQILEDFIQEFAKQEVTKTLEETKKFESIFKDKVAHIQDGTFEDFITEFTLNEYIHLVNCQNWFTGVTAFYKNVNATSKRAAQIAAPGRQGSNSGKQEFMAATISDVFLSSTNLEALRKQVIATLKKEQNFKSKEDLDKAVDNIVAPFEKINIGDGQGYMTLQGYSELLLKQGRYTASMEALLTKVKDGYKPNVKEALTIQAVKTFEYGLTHNSALNLTTPSQVKLSYAVLIPQLTAGTDLDLLRKHMEQTNISRVYFESAHKIGANFIQKIHNEDGTINPEALKTLTGSPYKYDNEQVQLEIPSHLEDDVNKLATQIAKLVVTNLSKSATYVVGGKEYTNTELQEHYFNILNANIEEDTQKLIEDLQLEKNENGQWSFKTKEKLQEFLKEEVISRNLSDNYLDALELDENGDFVLPLFINNMSKKWESILTSLFSNRIMRQKIEGASVTLTSTFGITNKLEQNEFEKTSNTKADIILPIGTSGSGKSTFIKSLPQENLAIIEPDAMRVEFTGNINDKSKDKEIYEEAAKRAIAAIQGKETPSQIYSKLGNKTKTPNIVIQSVYQTAGVQYAKSINGVFSLRINGTNNQFGNPFSNVESEIQKGLIRTKSTRESVEKYIEWVLSDTTTIKPEQHKFIREHLQSGKLKNKPIVYYKELGEPSHATALDYLINKYDWNEKSKQVVFDTTNLTKDKRLPFIEAIKKAIPTANIQYKLMELNSELAKQRIKAQIERGENRANVSDETIDRHAASYKEMLEDIKSEDISNYDSKQIKGIEWADSHKENQELKVYVNDNGMTVVQVVMGAWSKKFFNEDGNRMSINDIPLDLRQQIAYRIPTASKSYMFVLEVVGLLPEQSKGMIIVPNDMITKTGSDFDIDKFFLMYKNFYKTKSDKFIIPKYSEKEEIELYREYLNDTIDKLKDTKDAEEIKELKAEIEEVKQKMASLGTYDKDSRLLTYNGSRAARNNEIIDIYKAVISHSEHQKEGNIGAEFGLLKDLAATANKIYNKDDKNNSAVTGRYQRELRKRNRTGKDVLGIAANYNMFTAIAQTSGMRLNSSNGFKSKVKIKGEETQYDKVKDVKELEEKYGKENVKVEGDFAVITHTAIGFSNKDYLNIDNQPILDISSQGLNASVDNANEPTLGTLNLGIFTYPVFHVSTAIGQSIENAGFFYNQPILRALTAKIDENNSILNDGNSSGKEREDVRRDYKVKAFTVYYDNFKDRLDAKIEEYNKKEDKKYKSETIMKAIMKNNKFLPKKLTDFLFENDYENIKSFSTQELHDMLVDDALNIKGKLAPAKQIKLYINQMSILNDFGNRKATSETVDRVIRSTKTDSIGAGAELNVSTKLINGINRLGEDTTVMIDGVAAVKKIYPKHFGLNEQSKYLPLETYFENVNKLSKEILSPLFITESPAFIELKRQISKKIIVTEAVGKKIDNFLNYLTYQNFEMFDNLHFERVLGINNETTSLLEQYKAIKNEVEPTRNHILNMIQEKDNKAFKELVIKNYKDSGLDTVYASQIEELYNKGGVYKEFVEDLVRYTYFVHSLGYNFDSFAKVLPTKVLESMGMGKYAYQAQSEANSGILFSDDAKELFFRNNSQNKDIVPIVKTKFLKDENNKRIKQVDEDGQEMEGFMTINDTPTYELNNKGYLVINKKQLANENNNIKNSDYLNLAIYDSKTKTTSFKLLKKLTLDILPVNTEYKSSVGDIIEVDMDEYGFQKVQITGIEPANENHSFVTTKNIKSGKETTYEIHNSLGEVLTVTDDKGSISVGSDIMVTGFQMSDTLLENPAKTPIFDLSLGNNIYYEVNKLGNNGIYETESSVFSQNTKVNEVENYKNALISYLRIDKNNLGFMESTLKQIEETKTTCGI